MVIFHGYVSHKQRVAVLLVEAKVIPGESPPATGPMAPAMRALVTAGASKKRRDFRYLDATH
jgi:hypothetical protein